MRRVLAATGLLLSVAAAMPATAASDAPVRIATGLVSGAPGHDAAVTVFKGIPYAAPPVGDLRWRPPAAPMPWPGVRKADRFGARCPQASAPGPAGGSEAPAGAMDEDCLTLNVWTVAKPGERQPVVVFLHLLMGGAGSDPLYEGEGLVRKGVVLVTLNYRTGPFGFLASPELSSESGHRASGDYGLLDQIAALKWVRDNIAAFGGDPARVTLAETAVQRGSPAAFLAVSPLAKGLFQRVISGSHYPIPAALDVPRRGPSPWALATAEANGTRLMQARGAHSLAELRAMPWQDILKGAEAGVPSAGGGGMPRVVFLPNVDGWVVPKGYNDPASLAGHADAMLALGNGSGEGGVRTASQLAEARAQGPDPRGRSEPKLTVAAYLAWARDKFGDRLDEFLKLYPATTDDDAAQQNNAIIGDYARAASYFWAEQWAASGSKPVFTYWWTHPTPARGAGDREQRFAGHGSDVSYALGSLDAQALSWNPEDRRIADVMTSYWANIAKKGDPNGAGLPMWPAASPSRPQTMELGDHFGPIPVDTPEKLALWRAVYLKEQQRPQ